MQNPIIVRISPMGGGAKGVIPWYKRLCTCYSSGFSSFSNVFHALLYHYLRSFLFCRIDFGEINLFHRFVLRNFIYDLY